MSGNESQLQQLYTNAKCFFRGRSYPETAINIEGMIHHGLKPQCLDKKDCGRAQKKNKKRNLRK